MNVAGAGPHGLSEDLDLAVAAAREAGDVVMRWFRQPLDVRYKEPGQPLTEADLAADRTLRQRLMADRPDYGWLSEESADTPDRLERPRVWIVDPIDGTRSFIAGRPEFTISVGLAVDGVAAVGVVYNPVTGELFGALRDGGAWLHRGDDRVVLTLPATASSDAGSGAGSTTTLLASRTEIDAGEFSGFSDGWQVEPVGSTAYKLARIAAGLGDAFLSRGPKSEWDICAGVLLVREAGGRVTDLRGAEPRFNGSDPYVHGILAAGPGLHGTVMQHMARLPATDRLRPGKEG